MRAEHPVSKRLPAKAVVIEKRNTKVMTASAIGTVEEPGRNVHQKAGLNPVILGTGWCGPEGMPDDKAGERIEVDAASRTCSECGVVDSASRPSQAEFLCVACGHARNADAARNILASGTGASARREAAATSATREKDSEWALGDQCM